MDEAQFGQKKGKVRGVPWFPMPEDSEARQGFVTPEVFAQLLSALPKDLQPLFTFLYHTGCRLGAARKITWDMVNDDCSEIEIPAALMKARNPLTIPLVGNGLGELGSMLQRMFRKQGVPVFSSKNYRMAWQKTCAKLGLGKLEGRRYKGLLIHDLRRSGVRNLIRAGVDETVAMSISGHKTTSTFKRYNITDITDKQEALIKVGKYIERKTGAVTPISAKRK